MSSTIVCPFPSSIVHSVSLSTHVLIQVSGARIAGASIVLLTEQIPCCIIDCTPSAGVPRHTDAVAESTTCADFEGFICGALVQNQPPAVHRFQGHPDTQAFRVRQHAGADKTHRVWKLGSDIDADSLPPGACMMLPIPGITTHCLEAVRSEFAASVWPGDVVAAGPHFGIASSLGQAAGVLLHLGLAAVIAPSFGGLFLRNAFNLGLLLLTCLPARGRDHSPTFDIPGRARGAHRHPGSQTATLRAYTLLCARSRGRRRSHSHAQVKENGTWLM